MNQLLAMFCANSSSRLSSSLSSPSELGQAEEEGFVAGLCCISTGSSLLSLADYHSMVILERRPDLDQCCLPGRVGIAIAAGWIEMLLGKIR